MLGFEMGVWWVVPYTESILLRKRKWVAGPAQSCESIKWQLYPRTLSQRNRSWLWYCLFIWKPTKEWFKGSMLLRLSPLPLRPSSCHSSFLRPPLLSESHLVPRLSIEILQSPGSWHSVIPDLVGWKSTNAHQGYSSAAAALLGRAAAANAELHPACTLWAPSQWAQQKANEPHLSVGDSRYG